MFFAGLVFGCSFQVLSAVLASELSLRAWLAELTVYGSLSALGLCLTGLLVLLIRSQLPRAVQPRF